MSQPVVTAPRLTPAEAVNRHEDAHDEDERAFLREWLNGLNTQKAGIEQQAAAIRRKLGMAERERK